MIKTNWQSPLGEITILSDHQFLYGLWLEQANHYGAHYQLDEISSGTIDVADLTINWLTQYFNHQIVDPRLIPVHPVGTPFQMAVWQQLREIPYGQAKTYRELAQTLHSSPRAIGNAVGRNPISIIIPCHRILNVHQQMTGYAGGIARKQFLLELEGIPFKD